ncbi:MAG: YabP/YqfC family sporulation protein [Clostridia bacterium]|nr:YabP/YqfC family sporulation protein [Clostridia bacterium]
MKKNSLISGLIKDIDLPKTAFNGYAQTEIISNTEARIDGCKGIIEYSEEKISLNLGNICAQFCGSRLELKLFEDEQAVINGCFSAINFS